MPDMSPEFTIILESYNLSEGTDRYRFRRAVQTAVTMAEEGNGEVLIADAYGSAELDKMLRNEFPSVGHVVAAGESYDEAKAKAAQAASSPYLLFLDGDCLPAPGWNRRLLEGLQQGHVGCGGYTRYEGGFLAAVMSAMDFGFFYPRVSRPLKCYASNNCGFRASLLAEVPVPQGKLRCRCYYHAQRLLRRNTPVWFVPEARVLHELPPVVRERTRQGYDMIAACWADHQLREARWLKLGVFSVPLFYTQSVLLDVCRALSGRRDLGFSFWMLPLALACFPLFRLLDTIGMFRAFLFGPDEEGWGGCEIGSVAAKQMTAP